MRILLTNDDGYFATGIIYLAKKLKENGHEVYISAPMAEQSATSHALSLRHSIRIQEINMKDFTKGELDCPCVAVGGYPADCVKFALAIPYKDVKFDICISGINTCMNVGTDCIYSGTFSAACEATLLGLPAIAISAKMKGTEDYSYPANFLIENLEKLKKYASLFMAININIPWYNAEKIKGTVVTNCGWREYNDTYTKNEDGSYSVIGKPINKAETDHDDDCAWVDRGYIAIAPVPAYSTDTKTLEKMREEKWQ